jgi:hypothetical protein
MILYFFKVINKETWLTSNINIYTQKTNYQNWKLRIIKDLKRFKDYSKDFKNMFGSQESFEKNYCNKSNF